MGPPAPRGRNEGFPAGSGFDLARLQGANGECGGAGEFTPPRNGPYARESSRSARRQQQQMQEDEVL